MNWVQNNLEIYRNVKGTVSTSPVQKIYKYEPKRDHCLETIVLYCLNMVLYISTLKIICQTFNVKNFIYENI